MFPLSAFLFFAFASADYFTNPASFTTGTDGTNVQTQDLTYVFTLGQKVQITWFSPALDDVYVSLTIGYWDQGSSGDVLAAFITNEVNNGYYTWTVGDGDNIDEAALATSSNFMFHLTDVVGNHTSTGDPPGFVNHTLSSRGFVVKPNATSSATSCPTFSPPSSTTTAKSSGGLSSAESAGIGVSAGFVSGVLVGAVGFFLWRRPRPRQTPDTVEEKPAVGMPQGGGVSQVQYVPVHELAGTQRTHEVSGETPIRL